MSNPWTWTDKDKKRLTALEGILANKDKAWLMSKLRAAPREIDRLQELYEGDDYKDYWRDEDAKETGEA